MKYFTLDRWIAEEQPLPTEQELFEPLRAYNAYLDTVQDQLPADFVKILETICIHDGNLRELEIDIERGDVSLRLDARDITAREDRDVRLHYLGVARVWSAGDPEKGLPGPHGYGQIGNDEIEVVENGLYEHRILFSTGIELAIRFKDFQLEIL